MSDDYEKDDDIDRLRRLAADRGLRLFEAEPRLLLLDFDTQQQASQFRDMLVMLREFSLVDGPVLWTISQGGNQHCYVRMQHTVGNYERLIFQSLLGSDPKRELLTWKRMEVDRKEAIVVLLETKEEAAKVDAWLSMKGSTSST